MKQALRFMDKVLHWRKGIGPVYQASNRCFNNNKGMAYIGCNTYAGAVIKGHDRIYINNKLAATHSGLCQRGKTITGSNRIFLA